MNGLSHIGKLKLLLLNIHNCEAVYTKLECKFGFNDPLCFSTSIFSSSRKISSSISVLFIKTLNSKLYVALRWQRMFKSTKMYIQRYICTSFTLILFQFTCCIRNLLIILTFYIISKKKNVILYTYILHRCHQNCILRDDKKFNVILEVKLRITV